MDKAQRATHVFNRTCELAAKDTLLHRAGSLFKLVITLVYTITVVSVPNDTPRLLGAFFLYPALAISLGELPLGFVLKRCLAALAFVAFLCVSAFIFNPYPYSLLLSVSWLAKSLLCVSAVVIFASTTRMTEIQTLLCRLHVPGIVTVCLTMTFRYLTILLDEAHNMSLAYSLRTGHGIHIRDSGAFLGSLILRSFDCAERTWQARLLRKRAARKPKRLATAREILLLVLISALIIAARLIDFTLLLGGAFL